MSTGQLQSLLTQTLVWWPRSAQSLHGEPTYGTPSEILARYERTEKESVSADGQMTVTQAVADVVDAVARGDLLWLGALADLTEAQLAAPSSIEECWRVNRVEITPDLRGRDTWRTVYLG